MFEHYDFVKRPSTTYILLLKPNVQNIDATTHEKDKLTLKKSRCGQLVA
jgi:hypothetical protein